MKRFRTFSLTIIIVPFVVFACLMAFNLWLDPDHVFSKGSDYPFMSRGLNYYKNAGIINNYDVKNIIVGGSLMDNVVPSEVEAEMKWDGVYSLTMDASDPASVEDIMTYALARHKIGHVMASLQPEQLVQIPPTREGKRNGAKNFAYLYDENRLNDLMIFAQVPTYFVKTARDGKKQRKELNAVTFSGFTERDTLEASKDMYSPYMERYRDFNRPLFISSLTSADKTPDPLTAQGKQNLQGNFDQHIAPVLAANPKTVFYFIVPPSTYLARRQGREIFPYALEFLVEKLSHYPNARIYGFANDAFNGDLRLFKDLDHAHIEVSRFVVSAVAHDSHRLTPQNIGAYLKEFKEKVGGYKVPALWQTDYYELRNGPYPKEGYITYLDAAKLVWGSGNEKAYNSFPRSPYLAEKTYAKVAIKTVPPLDATRHQLETVKLSNN